MTTVLPAIVRSDVDRTLSRLRSGAPLTPTERDGLAELLSVVRSSHRLSQCAEHNHPESRSGLFRNITAVYDREFTAEGAGRG